MAFCEYLFVPRATVIEYIKRIHLEYSIYDDWIYVLDKPFASPFSRSGLNYYEYYIIDSAMVNGHWSHQLKFKPKRKQEPTFYGDFWVADSTFAVQRANMRMTPDANIKGKAHCPSSIPVAVAEANAQQEA